MTIHTSNLGEIFKRGAKKCTSCTFFSFRVLDLRLKHRKIKSANILFAPPLKWRFEKMRGYRGEEKLLLHQKFVLSPNSSFPLTFVFLPSRSLKHLFREDYKYLEQCRLRLHNSLQNLIHTRDRIL